MDRKTLLESLTPKPFPDPTLKGEGEKLLGYSTRYGWFSFKHWGGYSYDHVTHYLPTLPEPEVLIKSLSDE